MQRVTEEVRLRLWLGTVGECNSKANPQIISLPTTEAELLRVLDDVFQFEDGGVATAS